MPRIGQNGTDMVAAAPVAVASATVDSGSSSVMLLVSVVPSDSVHAPAEPTVAATASCTWRLDRTSSLKRLTTSRE